MTAGGESGRIRGGLDVVQVTLFWRHGDDWAVADIADTLAGIGLDPLGDVINTTNTTGIAAASSGYDAWGQPADPAGPTLAPTLGHNGQLQFGDLIDLRARDYDTTLGAFTTPDPLDGLDTTTTIATGYPYADNNPIAMSDPTGKQATDGSVFYEFGILGRLLGQLESAGGSSYEHSGVTPPTPDGCAYYDCRPIYPIEHRFAPQCDYAGCITGRAVCNISNSCFVNYEYHFAAAY